MCLGVSTILFACLLVKLAVTTFMLTGQALNEKSGACHRVYDFTLTHEKILTYQQNNKNTLFIFKHHVLRREWELKEKNMTKK